MTLSQGYAKFAIGETIKTTRPGHHIAELAFRAYAPDRRLCVHTALTANQDRTLDVWGKETRLLLTLKAPHKGISHNTLRWWLREALRNAGIDLNIFSPHSTRSASTSAADQNKFFCLPWLGLLAGKMKQHSASTIINQFPHTLETTFWVATPAVR